MRRIKLADSIPLRHPLTVHIETTNRCNFKCRYCPESLDNYGDLVGGMQTMTMADFRTICSQLIEMGTISVVRLWIMGEPLLNPLLPEFIKLLKNYDGHKIAERVEVTTNASALTEEKSRALLASPLDILKVSIYGIGDSHHHITQSKVSSEKILRNIEIFRGLRDSDPLSKVKIVIQMVDPVNKMEEKKFQDSYRHLADELLINGAHSWTDNVPGSMLTNAYDDEAISLLQTAHESAPKLCCPFPFYTIAIHVNGDVSTCCVDWDKKLRIGNVHASSLSDIWAGQKLKNIQNLHLEGKKDSIPACSQCTYHHNNCPENIDDSRAEILFRMAS